MFINVFVLFKISLQVYKKLVLCLSQLQPILHQPKDGSTLRRQVLTPEGANSKCICVSNSETPFRNAFIPLCAKQRLLTIMISIRKRSIFVFYYALCSRGRAQSIMSSTEYLPSLVFYLYLAPYMQESNS